MLSHRPSAGRASRVFSHTVARGVPAVIIACARGHTIFQWERIAGSKEQPDEALSLVMGVPTVYSRLIAAWEEQPQETRRSWTEACAGVRLMVCGSAALPEPTMKRWKEVRRTGWWLGSVAGPCMLAWMRGDAKGGAMAPGE